MICMSNRDNAHDVDIFPDGKITKRSDRTNQVQTKINIVKGLQTSVIRLIPGGTCHWISNRRRYFLKNIFWSTANCRRRHSRVFLVKPVLKISEIPQKNIPSKCQVTCNFVLKSYFTRMFFLEIYEIFWTAILRNYTFFCVSS